MLLSGFLALLSAACRDGGGNRVVDLQNIPVVELQADSLSTGEELLAPRKVFVLSGCLALYESKNTVGFLRFIDKRSGKLLTAYGNIGNAENEFLQPKVYASGSRLVITALKNSLTEVDFRDGQVVESLHPVTGEHSKLALGANFAAIADDGTVILSSPSSSDRLTILSADGSRKSWNAYPMEMPKNIDAFYCKEVIMQSSYAYCPSTGKLFAAAQYYPLAEVLDTECMEETVCRLEHTRRNEYEVRGGIPSFSDPILFYTFTSASRGGFYALWQHARKGEMRQGRSELHFFDAEGRLIWRYGLDRRIYHFSVEADDSRVYALGLNDDLLPVLYRYDLPQ